MNPAPYPSDCYLLRAERRFRWRLESGRPDLAQVRLVAKILPHARDVEPAHKERLGRFLARVEKAAVAFGELAENGYLDERFGFPVIIETPMGGVRTGTSPDGTPWERVLDGCSYGFLPNTVARDAEPLDAICGPDGSAGTVYLLAQMPAAPSPGMGAVIDEYKLGLGFTTLDDFVGAYQRNWPPELMGDITAMPIEVLRGLLGFELEGLVRKSLRAVSAGGLVATGEHGAVVGRVELVRKAGPAAPAPVTKTVDTLAAISAAFDRYFADTAEQRRRNNGASGTPAVDPPPAGGDAAAPASKEGPISVGTFAGGGLRLPGQGSPRARRGKMVAGLAKLVEEAEQKAARCAKAAEGVAGYDGVTRPAEELPADHPARTEPLTFTYDDPAAVGGWLGGIEPDDESWICFVDAAGRCLCWTQREESGAVVGDPVEMQRPDLAAAPAPSAEPALKTRAELGGDARIAKSAPSFEAINRAVYNALRDRYGVPLRGEPGTGPWMKELFLDSVVYEYDGKLFRVPYTFDAATSVAQLVGDPAPVEVAYVPLAAAGSVVKGRTEYLITLRASGMGFDGLKALVTNLQKHGGGGHSFGVIADESTTGADLVPKSGDKVVLGGWDGDGGAYVEWVSDEKVEKSNALAPPPAPADDIEPFSYTVKMLPVPEASREKRIVYGVVLEPEPFDGAGDAHDETYSAAVIEKAAYDWLASFRNFDDEHGRFLTTAEIVPVESYIARQELNVSGTIIKAGSWVVAARIVDDVLWARVLRGELTAWSIEGYAKREKNTSAPPALAA